MGALRLLVKYGKELGILLFTLRIFDLYDNVPIPLSLESP